MENMDEKNKRMQLERENHKKLSDEVQNVVVGICTSFETPVCYKPSRDICGV